MPATLLYKSDDAGATWMPVFTDQLVMAGELPPKFTDVAVDRVDESQLRGAAETGL